MLMCPLPHLLHRVYSTVRNAWPTNHAQGSRDSSKIYDLPCYEVALWAKIKINDVRNITKFSHPLNRLALQQSIYFGSWNTSNQIGGDRRRTNRITCDSKWREFAGKAAR